MAILLQERYVFQKQIGSGGMGEVWLATDTLLDRPVAIKHTRSVHDPGQKEIFLSEARMLARLNHPNITAIYDAIFDEQEHRFHLVMEYVDGEPLSNLIYNRSSPLPLDIMLEVSMGILRALQYAHGRGVVHLDIKPANVIIAEDVKLTDFGLASLTSLLAEGREGLIGTVDYMSPEQIGGRAIDGRADLYALGVMLYQMVSGGRLPFDYEEPFDTLQAHQYETPIPVRKFAPQIPLMLEHTIMRLLAKAAEDRYPTAEAVLNVLGSIYARQKFSQPHLQLLDATAKPFVGRQSELQQIEQIWSRVRTSGHPRLLVVQGEIGIGKSRLVAQFLGSQVVDPGYVMLVGRCPEFGAPYSPFAEVLEMIFSRELVKVQLVGDQAGHLLSQMPGLARILDISHPAASETGPDDPRRAQWQFFEAVLTILTQLGPTVLFLEDAGGLDEASAALIRFLIRHRYLPLLLVAACRDDEGLLPWLNSFTPAEKEVMTLRPMSGNSIRDYLVNLMGGPVSAVVVNTVSKRSHGNPFFMEEITRHLRESSDFYQDESGTWQYRRRQKSEPLPTTLIEVFARRMEKLTESKQIEKLGQESRQALTLAAVIGYEFDFETWLALLGGDAQITVALDALDEALGRRLLRDIGNDQYIFYPADIADMLVSGLTDPRRRYLHRKTAEILFEQPANPAVIAHHYQQAGLSLEAAHYLEAAGAKAMATNAINEAIDYYKRALKLEQSQSRFEALGHLYRQKGVSAGSIRAFRQALELARQADNVMDQARILNSLSLVYWIYDRYRQAYRAAASVLKLPGVSESERAIAQSHLGMISWLVGRLSRAEEWCQKSVEILLAHGDEASLAGAFNRLGLVYFSQGQLTKARAAFNRSLKIRRNLNDYWGQAYCLNNLGKVATEQGRFEQAMALLISAQQLFEKIDSPDGLMVVYTNQGRNLLRQKRAGQAWPRLTRALQLAMEIGKWSAYGLSDIYLLIAQASLELGKIRRARTAVDEALKLVEAAGNREYIALGQATLAQIYEVQGEARLAETMYTQALALFEQVGNPPGFLRTKLNYAQFLAKQGQVEVASTLEKEARDEAVRFGLEL